MTTPLSIVGGGLSGPLLAIYMARRGYDVTVYEMRPDMRCEAVAAGRSINLALAERGIASLRDADALEIIEDRLIPMRGRMIHALDGGQQLQPYGQKKGEVIYSVSRSELNQALTELAEKQYGVRFEFNHALRSVDPQRGRLEFGNPNEQSCHCIFADRIIASDGGGSVVRRTLAGLGHCTASEELLEHSYKELSIPAGDGGGYLLDAHALHIWPRGGFMLIALANPGGSFTVTLFLPKTGPAAFSQLTGKPQVVDFFAREFPDALALMPTLAEDFFANPAGELGTIRCYPYHFEDKVLLLGDAAHAVVPFHGQGMNCAFEDCRELNRILDHCDDDWSEACARFSRERKPNCDAIADMALENYVEMRDSVNDPGFVLRKKLSFELEKRFPNKFIPRYSMVMFHPEISYAEAKRRGTIQGGILGELTTHMNSIDQVDFDHAATLIAERL